MVKLKVPTLQHLARNWRDTPEQTCAALVSLAENSPTFNYNALLFAARDLLVFHQPYDEVVEGIRRKVTREDVRANLLGVLPLIRDHFEGISADFVLSVARRYYPVGRELSVPFEPPMAYGSGGVFHLPWFSFWRQNPLRSKKLSLFMTVADEILSQDPDLEQAKFHILDFSAPDAKSSRKLRVIESADVPRLSNEEKTSMLETFAIGYAMALEVLAGRPTGKAAEDTESRPDPRQGDLFGEPPKPPM